MKIRVQYTAQLRTALGRAAEDVELPEGSSVATLLGHLAATAGSATNHLVTPSGAAQTGLLVVVNESAVGAAPQMVVLSPGDVVTLLPPIAGG